MFQNDVEKIDEISVNHNGDDIPRRGVIITINVTSELNTGRYADVLKDVVRVIRGNLLSANVSTSWGHHMDFDVKFTGPTEYSNVEQIQLVPQTKSEVAIRDRPPLAPGPRHVRQ